MSGSNNEQRSCFSGWWLDGRINLGALVAAGTSLAVAVSLVVGISARLDAIEASMAKVEQRLEEARTTAAKVERIDERTKGIQGALLDIQAQLRVKRAIP